MKVHYDILYLAFKDGKSREAIESGPNVALELDVAKIAKASQLVSDVNERTRNSRDYSKLEESWTNPLELDHSTIVHA